MFTDKLSLITAKENILESTSYNYIYVDCIYLFMFFQKKKHIDWPVNTHIVLYTAVHVISFILAEFNLYFIAKI